MRKLTASAIILAVLASILALLGHASALVPDSSVVTSALDGYDAWGTAAFGPATFDTTGAVVYSSDGVATDGDACDQPTNVAGLIALVDRDNCTFEEKALNAQNGGAIGVIIANTSAGQGFSAMGGDASIDTPITVGTVEIRFADGVDLKAGLPLNARITRSDVDSDGVGDANDNCISSPNTNQANNDGDSEGDVCDLDDDNDGVADAAPDNCPLTANLAQTDTDNDGAGDACDSDDDDDGLDDTFDECDRIADASPDGCPEFTRTMSKPTYDKVNFRFAGTVFGEEPFCDFGFIYLYKEKKGADLLLGQTKSSSDGTWDIPLASKAKRGKYYAFVAESTDDDEGKCLAASSKLKRIK